MATKKRPSGSSQSGVKAYLSLTQESNPRAELHIRNENGTRKYLCTLNRRRHGAKFADLARNICQAIMKDGMSLAEAKAFSQKVIKAEDDLALQ